MSTLKTQLTLRFLFQTLFCGLLVASALTLGSASGVRAQSALVVSQCDEQHLDAAFAGVAPGATAPSPSPATAPSPSHPPAAPAVSGRST